MITHLRGRLIEKSPTHVVVECNGVGYFLNISLHTFDQLPNNENIFIYTHLQVREDAQILYGFMEKSEREVFIQLTSVSGIGPSTARSMLSSLTPPQIVEAITLEDVQTIKSVKGIGPKTAQRVIIDLKDKLADLSKNKTSALPKGNVQREEALSALETLGYKRKQSTPVVRKILADEPTATVEIIIKKALKKL